MNKKWYLLIGLSLTTIRIDGTKESRLEELRKSRIFFGVDISATEVAGQMKRKTEKTEKDSSPGPHPARRIRVWESSSEESIKDGEESKE